VSPAEVSAVELLTKLDARANSLRSFRALADMHYVSATDKLGIREVVVVERPDRLRIEMMSTFGVALQIATDGKTVRAFHRGDRVYYRGAATTENLARFTRLDLDLAEIADLLVGLPPARPDAHSGSLAYDRKLGEWRVSSTGPGGGGVELWFDAGDLNLARALANDSDGRRRYEANFGSYTTIDGVSVPALVRFEVPEQGAKIELRYSKISVNPALEASLFVFDAPPNTKIVDLDATS
jgi:outer membrane lipoprotein-sorting protein